MKPTLLILAAGIGARYGSVKQLDKMGPSGETILDYSVYDAIRAKKIEQHIPCEVVFQELHNVPQGIKVHPERVKPWGTAHAILVAKEAIGENFASINADDFYGYDAFRVMADYLSSSACQDYAMVGYPIGKTLSDHGSVSRGVCRMDPQGYLKGIVERTRIVREGRTIQYQDEKGLMQPLSGEETVSMNFWGFTPDVFDAIEKQFHQFIDKRADDLKAEFYIPFVIDNLIQANVRQTKVLQTSAEWFGVTYKEDREAAVARLEALVEAGLYPGNLWG
ncbi:MAG: nucleotidyltransferase [Bacteroidetes bacterium]|nr:MAG: nucleotidyltransferase [Bacteroidota bacterium]